MEHPAQRADWFAVGDSLCALDLLLKELGVSDDEDVEISSLSSEGEEGELPNEETLMHLGERGQCCEATPKSKDRSTKKGNSSEKDVPSRPKRKKDSRNPALANGQPSKDGRAKKARSKGGKGHLKAKKESRTRSIADEQADRSRSRNSSQLTEEEASLLLPSTTEDQTTNVEEVLSTATPSECSEHSRIRDSLMSELDNGEMSRLSHPSVTPLPPLKGRDLKTALYEDLNFGGSLLQEDLTTLGDLLVPGGAFLPFDDFSSISGYTLSASEHTGRDLDLDFPGLEENIFESADAGELELRELARPLESPSRLLTKPEFEREGRWAFRSVTQLPPPRCYQNLPKHCEHDSVLPISLVALGKRRDLGLA